MRLMILIKHDPLLGYFAVISTPAGRTLRSTGYLATEELAYISGNLLLRQIQKGR